MVEWTSCVEPLVSVPWSGRTAGECSVIWSNRWWVFGDLVEPLVSVRWSAWSGGEGTRQRGGLAGLSTTSSWFLSDQMKGRRCRNPRCRKLSNQFVKPTKPSLTSSSSFVSCSVLVYQYTLVLSYIPCGSSAMNLRETACILIGP